MASLSRFQKIALLSLGAVGGGLAYYRINNDTPERRYNAHNSWTTNFTPSVQWDKNWDHREPESIVKPIKNMGNPEEDNKYNEKLLKAKSRAVRHLFLIRHGQYNIDGAKDKDRTLTELGRLQADYTGQRLALLDIKWDCLVQSTMTRAQETGQIIAKHLDKNIEVKNCQLIEEGAPIPPEPPVGHWRPEPKQFFQDSARIEAGFRRYFHRAPPDQTDDTYTLLVCHANVIRYFVCKALQFPPEAWLRISLNHASITWISIMPNGNVILRSLSDTGHMEPKFVTSRNSSLKRNAKTQDCKEQNGPALSAIDQEFTNNFDRIRAIVFELTRWRHWQQFYQDSARIEAGFRRYFYRAPPDQQEDSYTLLVAHANVIRYYVCKALQFPCEGWLRMSVNHASITHLSILPNGNVILRCLSDSGFMEPQYITYM